MLIRTPEGAVDVTALQKRAAQQLADGVVTEDIKRAVEMLAIVSDELESQQKRLDDMRETMIYRNNI